MVRNSQPHLGTLESDWMDAQLLGIAMKALTKAQRWQAAVEIFHQAGRCSSGRLEVWCNNMYVIVYMYTYIYIYIYVHIWYIYMQVRLTRLDSNDISRDHWTTTAIITATSPQQQLQWWRRRQEEEEEDEEEEKEEEEEQPIQRLGGSDLVPGVP